MTIEDYIGYMAAFCTTCAFIPQVFLVVKTKDTKSISLGMYAVFCFGVALWLSYGLLKEDNAIILANIVTLVLASVVLIYKLKAKFSHDK